MNTINPWMVLLSEMLPAEPFIIAGTSLDEVDLIYYLSRRSHATPRRARGPSLLIEPYPDAASEEDCRKHDLVLVEGTIGDFLSWLTREFTTPPSPEALIIPSTADIFGDSVTPLDQLRFFSDFELVEDIQKPAPVRPSPYRYGAAPTWDDIHAHLDVERAVNGDLLQWARQWIDNPSNEGALRLVMDRAATGKSTMLMRLGLDLAALGHTVFAAKTLSKIDVATASRCLSRLERPIVLIVDDFASHVDQVVDLQEEMKGVVPLLVIGAERSYRRAYIEIVATEAESAGQRTPDLSTVELKQVLAVYSRLLKKHFRTRMRCRDLDFVDVFGDWARLEGQKRQFQFRRSGMGQVFQQPAREAGLLAAPEGRGVPSDSIVQKLRGDPVAVVVCRLLNDFRPIDRIVESLWRAATDSHKRVFLSAALAHWCYGGGIRHSILQSIVGVHESVDELTDASVPLALASNPQNDDYLVPQNAVIGGRALSWALKKEQSMVFEAFVGLGKALAPWVGRDAIRERTPEARLTGRLFDADKVVKAMLGDEAEEFYIDVKSEWECNSRYWEQRALLIVDQDPQTAIQYARRAASIEAGPFALTTLGKVLLRSLEFEIPFEDERESLFEEATYNLSEAIKKEHRRSRITIHPFMSLLSGVARWLKRGGTLTPTQFERMTDNKAHAMRRFSSDPDLRAVVERLDAQLSTDEHQES